jgi:hypothetical protein
MSNGLIDGFRKSNANMVLPV